MKSINWPQASNWSYYTLFEFSFHPITNLLKELNAFVYNTVRKIVMGALVEVNGFVS